MAATDSKLTKTEQCAGVTGTAATQQRLQTFSISLKRNSVGHSDI